MKDKPKSDNGNYIQKPGFSDQTRGQNPFNIPEKPKVPTPPLAKPKK